MLKQLDDQSNDVQSIAVKCLGILFKRVQEAQARSLSACVCACLSLCGISDHVSGFAPQPHRPTHQPNNKPKPKQVSEICDKLCGLILEGTLPGHGWCMCVYVYMCVSLSRIDQGAL